MHWSPIYPSHAETQLIINKRSAPGPHCCARAKGAAARSGKTNSRLLQHPTLSAAWLNLIEVRGECGCLPVLLEGMVQIELLASVSREVDW